MELLLKDTKKILTVSDDVFSCNFNEALVHQIVNAYAAGARQGTRAQKSRSEVSGSGRKPWRQKGTGRARAGSIKSPIWRSGGVTFAANSQDYSQKINKKMYRGGMRSIISKIIFQNRLIVVESFSIEKPKTKLLIQKLKGMSLEEKVLIITNDINKNLLLAARNLYKVDIRSVYGINPINLINFDKTIMTVNAIKQVEKMLS